MMRYNSKLEKRSLPPYNWFLKLNITHITLPGTYFRNTFDNLRSSRCRATPDSQDTTLRSSRYPPQTAGWAPNRVLSATLLSHML